LRGALDFKVMTGFSYVYFQNRDEKLFAVLFIQNIIKNSLKKTNGSKAVESMKDMNFV